MADNDYQLSLNDSFETWMNKFNNFVALTGTEINFRFAGLPNIGFAAKFLAGQIRNGSKVEEITATTLNLPASSSVIVGIYKLVDTVNGIEYPSSIKAYTVNNVPENYFVPIYAFTTDATKITTVRDLRTPFSYGNSGTSSGSDEAIMTFNKNIVKDTTIPSLKNALSISPIVNDGVTVTVEEDAEWVIL